jgi:hypothetical protein
MATKYEILPDDTVQQDGRTLHRIRRLSDGVLGGYIETQDNLAQAGNCFLLGHSRAYENVRITDNAQVSGTVHGDAAISGDSQIFGQVYGQAQVQGSAIVRGNAYDQAVIKDSAELYGQAFGHAVMEDNCKVFGQVYGTAVISGSEIVFGSRGS